VSGLYNRHVDADLEVRLAAFAWLAEQVAQQGDVLPRTVLQEGFQFRGQRIPLIGPQGIFKPRILEMPLSITTAPEGPYDDYLGTGDYLMYRYRGKDPKHRDNVGLRGLLEKQRPLVYLFGVEPGKYLAHWPVYVIGDDPNRLTFRIAVDDVAPLLQPSESTIVAQVAEVTDPRHAYITATVKVRLYQRIFRERVINAYRSECAFCRLRHRELLDAAHIIPDTEPDTRSTIDNGLSLCKLHHAAFDSFIVGVTPDYEIRVRADVLQEEDGPVLKHALQQLHGVRLQLPSARKKWPSRAALDWRYSRFQAIS
jgi:putative restriction endonuclease